MLTFALSAFASNERIAPLPIKQRTLPNGLKVVSVQDTSSPTTAIHVWYNVGSKDDPEGTFRFRAFV